MNKFLFPKWVSGMVALFLLIMGCAQETVQRKYFLLEYPPVLKDSTLYVPKPFPYKLLIHNMKLPRTYDRTSIVVRYSSHQIDYYRYSLWAIRPQILVSDLIARHFQEYKLFLKSEREFLDEKPDYEVVGYINAIEQFDNKLYTAAHLSMVLYVRRSSDFALLVKHEFDRTEELPTFEMSLFAKTLSDILREENDNFVLKIINYFNSLRDQKQLHAVDEPNQKEY